MRDFISRLFGKSTKIDNEHRHYALLGFAAAEMIHEMSNWTQILDAQVERLAENATEKMAPDQLRPAIERLRQISGTLSQQLHRARAFCQGRPGIDVPLVRFDLLATIGDVVAFCENKFSDQKIAFQYTRPDEDVIVLARPGQIAQMVLILLNNSVAAVRENPMPWIEIRVLESPPLNGRRRVQLQVIDSGVGDGPVRKKTGADKATSGRPHEPGMGLGLKIARALAEEQGIVLFQDVYENRTTFGLEMDWADNV